MSDYEINKLKTESEDQKLTISKITDSKEHEIMEINKF